MRLFSALPTRAVLFAGALVPLAFSPAVVTAQSVGVTLNGTPINLNPPPTERAGRIFVPLRGIFEQLDASVVYQGGTINAQGNGRSVSLHIGSTQATVNGQPQSLDVAPFVVGASTYVPLRFVSQALGANVNYDAANKIVALSNGATQAGPPAPATNRSPLHLGRINPDRGATVQARRPTIAAQFVGGQADPNSLRISLDGLDITAQTSRSPSGFVFSPPSDLQTMQHTVRVTGNDSNGLPFLLRWPFTSGTSTAADPLRLYGPSDGQSVGTQFTVSGQSSPGALVDVQVGVAGGNNGNFGSQIGSILGLGGGASARNEVTANADGSFSTVISINAPPGANLALVVNATDPNTKAAARPVRRMLVVQ